MDQNFKEKIGEVRVADDVFAAIAGLAATEVAGVASLAGGLTHDRITKSGNKSLSKCVRVAASDGKAEVRIALVLDGTVPIPEVSREVRAKVHDSLELMTGIEVSDVEVTIAGVTV